MLALALLSCPLIFYGLGQYGVVNADEAFYHDIAWTMLESGNWFVLRTGDSGEHIYDTFANAPLQYWVRGVAIEHLGPGPLGMRVVSACSALLAVLATYLLALRVGGRRAAFLAALVLLTSFQFLYLHSARTGELEPGVCLLLVLAAHLFLRAVEEPQRGFVAHHIVVALLLCWKAPVTPIPIIAEIACFALLPQARARLRDWIRTGLVVLPFALIWHVGQAIRLRELLPDLLAAVAAQAAGGAERGLLDQALYYGQKVLFGAFPWSLLHPIALLVLAGRALRGRALGRPTPLALQVLGLFALAIVAFYLSISKVGPWYLVHALPFLAVAVGLWLAGLHQRGVSWSELGAISLALSWLIWLTPPLADMNPFAQSAIGIPMQMRWRAIAGLPAPSSSLLLALVIFSLAALLKVRVGARLAPLLTLLLAVLFSGYAIARALMPLRYVDHLSPVAALAAELDDRRLAGEPIPLPIELPPAHPWTVHYYFGRDFELRPANSRGAATAPGRSRFVLTESHPRSREHEAATGHRR